MSPQSIVHVEISTTNREESGKFYSELFGWEVQQMPEMNYATFTGGEGVGGGFNPVSEQYPAGTITFYVQTNDVTGDLLRAQTLGGKILVPRSEIPGVGWFGFFADPSGNMIGLIDMIPPQG